MGPRKDLKDSQGGVKPEREGRGHFRTFIARGECWVWGPKGQMRESVSHPPWRTLWALNPEELINLHFCTLRRYMAS
jgi:hypothetical protein